MKEFEKGIDLHAHTTASDGSLTPTELVEKASKLGLKALAVTDHDTISGLEEAMTAAKERNLTLIPGVELSVEDEAGRFHLLGYAFHPKNEKLAETLVELRAARAARNEQMAEKMAELGLPVTMDDVRAEAGEDGEVIARPHFAQALIKKGIVSSVKEAFDKYLSMGKPLYLPKKVLTPARAIELLHEAGGVAVMAHPGLIPMGDAALAARIEMLAGDAQMDGLEVFYSQHTPSQTQRFLALARQNNLIMTGGSDFHGTPKPHVPLGVVYENRPAPAEILTILEHRAEFWRPS